MTQSKLNIKDLRNIIKEELSGLNEAAKEQAVHKAKAAISAAASDLLDAIDAFKEKASPHAMGAVVPHIDLLKKILDHMTDAPGAYVQAPRVEPKRVSLKAVKSSGE